MDNINDFIILKWPLAVILPTLSKVCILVMVRIIYLRVRYIVDGRIERWFSLNEDHFILDIPPFVNGNEIGMIQFGKRFYQMNSITSLLLEKSLNINANHHH